MKARRENRDHDVRALAAAARQAARKAYAPYSRFAVGVALRASGGAITCGFNVENASYPLGICAERAALLEWRVNGGKRIDRLLIHTDTAEPTSPCGLCRDALARWAAFADVYLSCRGGISGPYPVSAWLPSGSTEGPA